jgi:ABC-type dipeptide/oligopeptide/nickel transport system permease component
MRYAVRAGIPHVLMIEAWEGVTNFMRSFLIKRGINAVLTILVIITLTFILMHSVPGGPFTQEKPVPPAILENLNKFYHLDEPVWKQYFRYVGSLLQGDLGPSYKSQSRDVNQMLKEAMPVTVQLGLQALVVAVIGGLFLGITSALYHNRIPDRVATVLAVFGTSVPSFVIATLLIQFLAVQLHWFPVATWASMKHTVLPTLALSASPLAQITRLMRSNMLEVLNQDYIKTAKAKGLPYVRVVVNHAIRNAILPVITILGPITAHLVTGSFVIEKIFSVPGSGKMLVDGINNRDYSLIMGTTVVYGIALVVILFVVDLLYSIIDPRIKLRG